MARVESVFPVDYEIYTSLDGENFTLCDAGAFRWMSGEEIVRFAPTEARFVRFCVLSTAGQRLGRKPYDAEPLKMAEISLFE